MGLGSNFSPCSGGNFMSKIEKIIGANIGRALIYIILDAICIDFSILVGIGMWFDGTLPGASKMGIPPTVWSWYFIIVVIAPVVCWFFYAVFPFLYCFYLPYHHHDNVLFSWKKAHLSMFLQL